MTSTSSPMSRRRLTLAWAAAATVVVLAIGIFVALRTGGPRATVTQDFKDTLSLPFGEGNVLPRPPSGKKSINFQGLTVDVPQQWPLNATTCDKPRVATYILPTFGEMCEASNPPNVDSVNFFTSSVELHARVLMDDLPLKTPPLQIKGDLTVQATRSESTPGSSPYLIETYVDTLGAGVLITGMTQQSANELASTLSVHDFDQNGCLANGKNYVDLPADPAQAPAASALQKMLVPQSPARIVLCRSKSGHLQQSAVLTGSDAEDFTQTINSVTPGLSRTPEVDSLCAPALKSKTATAPGEYFGNDWLADVYTIFAVYPDGQRVSLISKLGFCGDLGVTNGVRTGQRTEELIGVLVKLVGSRDGGAPVVVPR